ncbi:MAG: DNA-binding protein WhiA [Clostridia bacterium]|nr:DNA-binding protein WhiA [Clostridia bacterium]
MSFASEVKNELSMLDDLEECCQKAAAYGLLIMGRSFTIRNISLQTENEAVAKQYSNAITSITGLIPDSDVSAAGKITVKVSETADCRRILEYFGHTGKEPSLRINRANFTDDCCQKAFVRGAFLACGAVTDPNKNYHFEFSIPFMNLTKDFLALLKEMDFAPKQIIRKGGHVIYFKESETIEDLLTTMGAVNSSLEIMGVKVLKDIKNMVNRRTNCETANLTKTINAACKQIEEIEFIEKKMGQEFLPDDLAEIAALRKENPDISLGELGQLLNPPLSRSGVNHRMKRIRAIYEDLRK